MLHVQGGTDRTGGAMRLGNYTLTQANSTQKAAASPEGSAELWYALNPLPESYTLTIPNAGALTIRYQIGMAAAAAGSSSFFRQANGGNGTSTNPTAGALSDCRAGDIVFGAVFSGATTWAPSARTGTQIQDTDDGAFGGGTQYSIIGADGSFTPGWTFGTSDDWGAVGACFGEWPAPALQSHYGFDVGDGMSVAEKVR